jgi:hypothetical protein
MANTILTPTAVTREALRVLHQKLTFIGSINRQYDDQYARTGAKIGDTLKIRLPNQYVVTNGATLVTQDTVETSTSLQIQTQKHVGMNFTSVDLTLSIDDFSSRFVEPAAAVLAAAMEADALSMRTSVWNQVNNTGSAATLNRWLGARKKLNDNLTPESQRTSLLCTQDTVDLVDSLKTLFHDDATISEQYREGMMGHTVGFDFMETTHLINQQRGAASATYVVGTTSSVQGGTTISVATGTGAMNVGDVFTVGAVDMVHPETKIDMGTLQQFVVTAPYPGGAGNVSCSPAQYTTGAQQNISAFPTAAAPITFVGTISTPYGQSMVYHKDAFTFATADLVMPKGVDWGARETFDGISLRIVRQYDIVNDKFPIRMDVLYGYKALRPQMACRIACN